MSFKSYLFIYLLLIVQGKALAQDSSLMIIENVNVIPMTEEKILFNQRVLIFDGKILRIESANKPLIISKKYFSEN